MPLCFYILFYIISPVISILQTGRSKNPHMSVCAYQHDSIHTHKWTTAPVSIPRNPTHFFPETTDSFFGPGFHDKANVLFTQRCLGIKEACWDGPEPAQLLSTPSTDASPAEPLQNGSGEYEGDQDTPIID